jgi:hypothetical protein
MDIDDPLWVTFSKLQNSPDPQTIDKSLAREEALNAVLEDVLTASNLDAGRVSKRFRSVCRNRLSKQRLRRTIDRDRLRSPQRRCGIDFGPTPLTSPIQSPFDLSAANQLIDLLSTVLSADDLRLITEIADGRTYSDVARVQRRSVASIKAKVFRARERVRTSTIAPVLRNWLRG